VAIGTAAEVERKKPDPAVYRWVLERLRVEPDRVVAIEDNRNGLLAATGAGLRCVVTPTPYSAGEDFTTALAVAETLDHHPGRPGAVVRLNDLRDWMAQAPR
jgi:beta-phosphoglucomutase-like phosphatase (HAD superfamily)